MAVYATVKTGQVCSQTGLYRCQDHPTITISLSKGDKAPPCQRRGYADHGTTWECYQTA